MTEYEAWGTRLRMPLARAQFHVGFCLFHSVLEWWKAAVQVVSLLGSGIDTGLYRILRNVPLPISSKPSVQSKLECSPGASPGLKIAAAGWLTRRPK
jgi:hypothetical protein